MSQLVLQPLFSAKGKNIEPNEMKRVIKFKLSQILRELCLQNCGQNKQVGRYYIDTDKSTIHWYGL
jgi:hypothetical protein